MHCNVVDVLTCLFQPYRPSTTYNRAGPGNPSCWYPRHDMTLAFVSCRHGLKYFFCGVMLLAMLKDHHELSSYDTLRVLVDLLGRGSWQALTHVSRWHVVSISCVHWRMFISVLDGKVMLSPFFLLQNSVADSGNSTKRMPWVGVGCLVAISAYVFSLLLPPKDALT